VAVTASVMASQYDLPTIALLVAIRCIRDLKVLDKAIETRGRDQLQRGLVENLRVKAMTKNEMCALVVLRMLSIKRI
jgi:hypothetical protein